MGGHATGVAPKNYARLAQCRPRTSPHPLYCIRRARVIKCYRRRGKLLNFVWAPGRAACACVAARAEPRLATHNHTHSRHIVVCSPLSVLFVWSCLAASARLSAPLALAPGLSCSKLLAPTGPEGITSSVQLPRQVRVGNKGTLLVLEARAAEHWGDWPPTRITDNR